MALWHSTGSIHVVLMCHNFYRVWLTIDTSWGRVFRLVNGSAFCSTFISSWLERINSCERVIISFKSVHAKRDLKGGLQILNPNHPYCFLLTLNSPRSNNHVTPCYNIHTSSRKQVMRITKLNRETTLFSLLIYTKIYSSWRGESTISSWELKG